MARTEEEIQELVNNIADYIIKTKCSTREAAKYFKVSNYTVSNYMSKRLSKSDLRYEEVKQILGSNRQTIDNGITRIRILKELKLLMEGKTCDAIASIMNISSSQVSRDLSDRLPKLIEMSKKNPEEMKEFYLLPKEILIMINKILRENSEINLKIGSNMHIQNQERDKRGRFK